ncbi:hypothetical protein B566_EDAN008634 [Ephemera danica]|nr:hypothetical protein B566_EDAN008634 [Ephemera danica]
MSATTTFVDRIDPFAKRSLKKKQKKSQGSSRYRNSGDVELQALPLLKGKSTNHSVLKLLLVPELDIRYSVTFAGTRAGLRRQATAGETLSLSPAPPVVFFGFAGHLVARTLLVAAALQTALLLLLTPLNKIPPYFDLALLTTLTQYNNIIYKRDFHDDEDASMTGAIRIPANIWTPLMIFAGQCNGLRRFPPCPAFLISRSLEIAAMLLEQ